MRAALEKMLAGGRDDALLRFSLGSACLKDGDPALAAEHLRKALNHDASYSAAWKLLGQALLQSGQSTAAAEAWREGIATAEARGDVQAAREMAVFLKRLHKQTGGAEK